MDDEKRLSLGERISRFVFGYTPPPKLLYLPLKKYYLFNETGNILICTSAERVQGFDDYIKDAFTDVSVFLAAMTKALACKHIAATESDNASIKQKSLSLYNYQAMKDMFAHSAMFVQTNAEHGFFTSRFVGETLGKEFVQTALGKKFDERTLSFTRGMFNGMRYQQNTNYYKNDYARGGHVFFICEMLNGLPTTSVVLISIENKSGKTDGSNANTDELKEQENGIDILDFGSVAESDYEELIKKNKVKNSDFKKKPYETSRTWRYRKRTYLFIPPNFLKNATRILNLDMIDGYDDLVMELTRHINQGLQEHNSGITSENLSPHIQV